MNLIVWLRSFSSPALDTILGYVTDLGSTMFYLVAVPIVYWCINRRAGYVIGMTVLAGGVCTDLAKAAISAPRPFEVNDSITPSEHFLETAIGSGMPSGHSFNSMGFWLASAMKAKRSWFTALSATLIFVIGFTRMYGGVHFPLQVLWGWAGGAALAVMVGLIAAYADRQMKGGLANLALAIAGLVLIAYTFLPGLSSETAEDYIGLIGIIGGMSLGYYLHNRFVRTSAAGPAIKQVIKLVIGFAGFLGLRMLADDAVEMYPRLLLPLYFILGVWPSFMTTMLFKALNLEKEQ